MIVINTSQNQSLAPKMAHLMKERPMFLCTLCSRSVIPTLTIWPLVQRLSNSNDIKFYLEILSAQLEEVPLIGLSVGQKLRRQKNARERTRLIVTAAVPFQTNNSFY